MTWQGFRDIRATIEIDLGRSEEELWNSLDKDARWGVKKAEKEGLKIGLVDQDHDFLWEEFYDIYKDTCRYGNIPPLSFEEIKKGKLFGCFMNNEGKTKLIAGSVIEIEDDSGKIILYLNSSNHEYLKLQPNNLLYWKMIKWAKKKRFKIFDLGGYQINAQKGDKLYEINRFKMRWGGEIREMPVYSKNPFYILGRKVIRNFPKIKKMRDDYRVKKNTKDKE